MATAIKMRTQGHLRVPIEAVIEATSRIEYRDGTAHVGPESLVDPTKIADFVDKDAPGKGKGKARVAKMVDKDFPALVGPDTEILMAGDKPSDKTPDQKISIPKSVGRGHMKKGDAS